MSAACYYEAVLSSGFKLQKAHLVLGQLSLESVLIKTTDIFHSN